MRVASPGCHQSPSMSSTLAASRGTHAGGAAQAGLRRGSSVLPVLPWSGSVLKQPKQQQPQQRRTAAAALSGRRQRRAVRAVAAPLAPEVSASEHTVELHAAVEAVRLASRLCQASHDAAARIGSSFRLVVVTYQPMAGVLLFCAWQATSMKHRAQACACQSASWIELPFPPCHAGCASGAEDGREGGEGG